MASLFAYLLEVTSVACAGSICALAKTKSQCIWAIESSSELPPGSVWVQPPFSTWYQIESAVASVWTNVLDNGLIRSLAVPVESVTVSKYVDRLRVEVSFQFCSGFVTSFPSEYQAQTDRAINCTQSDRLRSRRAVPFSRRQHYSLYIHRESLEISGQPVLARPKLW